MLEGTESVCVCIYNRI